MTCIQDPAINSHFNEDWGFPFLSGLSVEIWHCYSFTSFLFLSILRVTPWYFLPLHAVVYNTDGKNWQRFIQHFCWIQFWIIAFDLKNKSKINTVGCGSPSLRSTLSLLSSHLNYTHCTTCQFIRNTWLKGYNVQLYCLYRLLLVFLSVGTLTKLNYT